MLGCGITGGIKEVLAGDKTQIQTSLINGAVLSVAYDLP